MFVIWMLLDRMCVMLVFVDRLLLIWDRIPMTGNMTLVI